jgi:hypothetical protein
MNFNNRLALEQNNSGTRRTGQQGRCYLYDGTDDYSALDSTITASGDFSLSWNMNATSFSSAQHVFFQSANDRIYFNNGGNFNFTANSLNKVITVSPAIAAGTNYKLCLVRLSDTLTLYVNGVAQADTEVNANDFKFYQIGTPGSFKINAAIFDVRYFTKALTASEVQFVSTFGESGDDPSLPANWWKCDEQSGVIGYDSVGGNNLTHTNITAANFHATQDVWSFQNQVGYNRPLDRSATAGGVAMSYPFAAQPASSYEISYWVKCENYAAASVFLLSWDSVNGLGHYFQGAGVFRAKHIAVNLATTKIYADGLWHRVLVTWNGSTLTLQVDSETKSTACVGSISSANLLNALYSAGATTTHISNLKVIIDGQTIFDSKQGDPSIDLSGNGNSATGLGGSVLGSGIDVYTPRDESDSTNDVLGNPLTYTGTRPNDASLINSSCLDLNGTNQAVRVADNTDLDITDNLTVCVWAKNNNALLGSTIGILNKGDLVNKREWYFGLNGNEKIVVAFGDSDGAFVGTEVSDDAPTLNEFNHYAFTFYGGVVEIYLNGVNEPSTTTGAIPVNLNNEDGGFSIGGLISSGGLLYFWDGQVFDARIYAGDSTVLTAAQILSIYQDGINNVEFAGQSLRAHYVCAEGAGAGVLDYSGNGNDGTIENAVTNWGVTQDVLHFNLLEGFSLYEHASSDPIRVKFVNGSSRSFTPPTGYTLTGHYPAGSDLIPAETEINFNPDSTPEMGSTQLGFTVPAAHEFGDVLPSYYKMFSRKTDTSEDRFIVFKDALYNTDLTRIRQYTGKTAYPLDDFKDSIIGAWSTRRLFSDLPTPSYLLNGRDGTTNTLDFAEPELPGGILSLANGGNAFVPQLYDQSGNGNHATQTVAASQPKLVDAGSLIVDASGRPVMDFDTVDDTMTMGVPVTAGTSDVTFAFKASTIYPDVVYLLRSIGGSRVNITVASSKLNVRLTLFGFGTFIINSTTDFDDGNLHLGSVTLDRDGFMRLYFDGSLEGSIDISAGSAVNFILANQLIISQNSPQPMQIAEIMVFDSVLTQSEITQLHNALA